MLKKRIIVALIAVVTISLGAFVIHQKNADKKYVGKITTNAVRDGYIEHAFDLPSSQDVYTRLALEKIIKSEQNLIQNAQPIVLPEWQYIEENPPVAWSETFKVNGDTYQFKPTTKSTETPAEFSVYKNDEQLFTSKAEYGAEGAFVQKVLLNDIPGFTIRTSCTDNSLKCDYDIYYDGQFLSKPMPGIDTSIKNPHFLFTYNGKLGFINDIGDNKKSIVFDGHYITDNFDEIHFENCCAIQELLPTLYDNGVLIFYAKRQNQNYIVEVDLKAL